jgi:hypothetical protein
MVLLAPRCILVHVGGVHRTPFHEIVAGASAPRLWNYREESYGGHEREHPAGQKGRGRPGAVTSAIRASRGDAQHVRKEERQRTHGHFATEVVEQSDDAERFDGGIETRRWWTFSGHRSWFRGCQLSHRSLWYSNHTE